MGETVNKNGGDRSGISWQKMKGIKWGAKYE